MKWNNIGEEVNPRDKSYLKPITQVGWGNTIYKTKFQIKIIKLGAYIEPLSNFHTNTPN